MPAKEHQTAGKGVGTHAPSATHCTLCLVTRTLQEILSEAHQVLHACVRGVELAGGELGVVHRGEACFARMPRLTPLLSKEGRWELGLQLAGVGPHLRCETLCRFQTHGGSRQ